MKNILGIKLSADNIAWSLLETEDFSKFRSVHKGIEVFPKGVKITKTGEVSRASEKTQHRSAKVSNYRTKVRKINVLRILSEHDYCPPLSYETLTEWRTKKVYPMEKEFRNWLMTNNQDSKLDRQADTKNPYFFRNLAVTEKLNLKKDVCRYMLGRAFYHMTQRRGYLSNRLDSTEESDGKVMESIKAISAAKNDKTLGQYFYEEYKNGSRVRGRYTHRIEHYMHEFNEICKYQKLPQDLVKELRDAIFYQRPLKICKQTVGKCPYEKSKFRCAISHPDNEDYRMMAFVNNIRIKKPAETKLRPLNLEEKAIITPLFYRKTKSNFDFEDIAKKLSYKNKYKHIKEEEINETDTVFNFTMKTSVPGCPASTQFLSLFGENWRDFRVDRIRSDNTQSFYDINDIWSVLNTFDDDEKLADFAMVKLGLNEKQCEEFLKIKLPNGHSHLSLNAISKILVYLNQGLSYSHAVFMANMHKVIPKEIWAIPENVQIITNEIKDIIEQHADQVKIYNVVNSLIGHNKKNEHTWSNEAASVYKNDLETSLIKSFGEDSWYELDYEEQTDISKNTFEIFKLHMLMEHGTGKFANVPTLEYKIKIFLTANFNVTKNLDRLYHPSSEQFHSSFARGENDQEFLPSAEIIPLKSPNFQRVAYQIQKVVNKLIHEKLINSNTIIRIYGSEGIHTNNQRNAYADLRREKQKQREAIQREIKLFHKKQNIEKEITEDDYRKYELWQEQKEICYYTGRSISFDDIFGEKPNVDLNYIIPVSQCLNTDAVNQVLCDTKYANKIKRDELPGNLLEKDTLIERIRHINEQIYELENTIAYNSRLSKGASTMQTKNKATINKNKAMITKDYLRKKNRHLFMQEVNDKYIYAVSYDNSLMPTFAKEYLNAVFNKVYVVSKQSIELLKREWQLGESFDRLKDKKYFYHYLDALTAACMAPSQFETIQKRFAARERGEKVNRMQLPWFNFLADQLQAEQELLVFHKKPIDLLKKSKRVLRKNNKVVRDKNGDLVYQRTDTIRGALTKDTIYGAINHRELNEDGTVNESIRYVVRKEIASLQLKDVDNIVNPTSSLHRQSW